MAFFTTNDKVKINYHSYGAPDAPTIVLVNGYSASEITWLCQIEPFVAAGFRVITYDHRGHGLSDKVKYGLTLARLATDLHELLVYLEIFHVILIGHSMGAALIMAYEELFTDKKIDLVITEDQAPTFLRSSDWLDGDTGRTLAELSDFMEEFPKTRLTRKKLSDDVKRSLGKSMYPFDFRAYQGLLRNIITQDWRANLAQETKAHLFLAGSLSPIFPPEHAQAARNLQTNPNSQAIIFEGCGHLLHLEDADKFNQTILKFIKKNIRNL
ncbi:alpha/beta fold hydrolase [Lactococcus nasutitermitis]|uniref:Alpha/beta fold hydrolase n=1 Tax=Lactococcus nasutitermitis TaxID=1652957 RepID=A0ABV9JEA7_9LACT|nr:alpha/beta hydrolase [Lactococcus nasutitermitis]